MAKHGPHDGEEIVADEFGNADHPDAGFIPTLDFHDSGSDQDAVELEDQGELAGRSAPTPEAQLKAAARSVVWTKPTFTNKREGS